MADKKSSKPSQRRNAVRIDVLLPVYFTVMKHDVVAVHLQPPNLGSTINLSSTGMLMATDRELSEGSKLMLSFKLLEGEPEAFCEATVLHTAPQQEGAIKKFLSHLQFNPSDDEFTDKVAHFVIHRQQALRRQGLL